MAIALLALPLSHALAADALRGVALVIGEGDYQQLPRLANPKDDARAIGDLLYRLGFDVMTVSEAGRKKLSRSIDRFIEDAQNADVALVYYSGHGVEVGGEDYLIPVDAEVSSPKTAGTSLLPVTDLLDRLQKAVPVTILLLDACRTNPFTAGQLIELPGATSALPVTAVGLGAVRGPTPIVGGKPGPGGLGTVIGFAAEPGKSALDGPAGANSPYAAALLRHIAAGGYSFADVMTLVTEEVYLKTDGKQLPWTNSALRRVLSFGTPVTEVADADEALIFKGRRDLLLTISSTPEPVRTTVVSIAEAEGVPLATLFGVLKAVGVDTSDPTELGKRLQSGAEEIKKRLEDLSASNHADPEVKRLLELVKRAQDEGALDEALQFSLRASSRTTQLSATLDTLAADIDQRRTENAATYAKAGDVASLAWEFRTATEQYGLAADEIDKGRNPDPAVVFDYRLRQGSALYDLGDHKGDNAALGEAIVVYSKLLTETARKLVPLEWAMTQARLGTALWTLGVRESGPGRLEEAVAAYRLALEEQTRERVPLDWATTQMNLGNALVMLGQRESGTGRLEEAVGAFRLALEEQTRERVPLAWATTQMNLGNALVMLGQREGGTDKLEEGVAAFRLALEEWTRERVPLDWATTQMNLGNALKTLGEREGGTDKLEEALAAYRLALEEQTRERVPLDWAGTQSNLGLALQTLGERESGSGRLEEAVAAYRLALEERTRERMPLDWAGTQSNLGLALQTLGERESGTDRLEQAIVAYRLALEVQTRERVPLDWAMTQTHLGNALKSLGERERSEKSIQAGRAA